MRQRLPRRIIDSHLEFLRQKRFSPLARIRLQPFHRRSKARRRTFAITAMKPGPKKELNLCCRKVSNRPAASNRGLVYRCRFLHGPFPSVLLWLRKEKPVQEHEPFTPIPTIDEATIIDLKQRKMLREQQAAVELDPVGPGETIIGYLTDPERALYCEMATLQTELNELQKEQHARSFEMLAHATRLSDKPQDTIKNLDDTILFPTMEEAEEYYALETRFHYLRALYMSNVRDRYKAHSAILGARTGFSVVRVGYKHKIPDELKKVGL